MFPPSSPHASWNPGALEAVLSDYAEAEYGVYVVRPPGSHVPAKVRVLIEDLVAHFGRESI
jgi:DNA-binding transcriptional LysR family regulator